MSPRSSPSSDKNDVQPACNVFAESDRSVKENGPFYTVHTHCHLVLGGFTRFELGKADKIERTRADKS